MRMLVTVEFADAGKKTGTHRILVVGGCRNTTALGDIGMTLEEAKTLLSALQWEFITAQAAEVTELARRGVRTLFGRVFLESPRLVSCSCDGTRSRAISPLKAWLARSSQELCYQAAKWGSAHSYRQAAMILQELLGVDLGFGYIDVRKA